MLLRHTEIPHQLAAYSSSIQIITNAAAKQRMCQHSRQESINCHIISDTKVQDE